MRLPPNEVELFYQLYYPLLVHANRVLKVAEGLRVPEDLRRIPLETTNELREALYRHPEVIEAFVEENPFRFPPEEAEIVARWRHFVQGTFYILRYLKKHTIFLDSHEPPRAYGVLALASPFEEMFRGTTPVMVEAVLLPFKGKIIYDGILRAYPILLGRGIREDLQDSYQEAKARFGVITSLPFSPEERELSEADRLRLYLRNARSREIYREEIEKLTAKDPKLLEIYHQEMGKIRARRYGRELRRLGVQRGWFALMEDLIVASGTTREEVEQIIQDILPKDKRRYVYIFQVKGKGS
jgi:hypothetical protein